VDKLRNLAAVLINGCLPLLAIPINGYLIDRSIPQEYSLLFLIALSICISLFFYFIIPGILFNLYFVRWIFDPLARFEGCWASIIDIENNTDGRVCGFFRFIYDRHESNYLYEGQNYNIKGETITSFAASDIQYKKEINGLRFFGTAKRTNENPAVVNRTTTINTWGEISFSGGKKDPSIRA